MRIRRTTSRKVVIRVLSICLILALISGLIPAGPTLAQAANLLENPGFEGQYTPFNGDLTRQVAPGWSAWHIARQPTDPGYFFAPEYRDAEDDQRVRSGSSAQELFSFYATYTGGVYQRVSVPLGATVRFSAHLSIWSSSLDRVPGQPAQSESPSRVRFEVGLDPTGGVNAQSDAVQWVAVENVYDQYRLMSVSSTASGGFVTAFIKVSFLDPVPHNHAYLDDAEVVVLSDAPTFTPSAIAQVPSATPSLTATHTEAVLPTLPPSSTPGEQTLVPVVTFTPSNTPSNTPAPSNTPLPTNTSTPVPGVPTREGLTPLPTRPSATPSATRPPATQTLTPFPTFPTNTPVNTVRPGEPATPTLTVFGTVPPEFPGRILYTVQRGDTLTEIAQTYDSSVQAIVNANGLNNAGLIFIGQQLVIPVRSQSGGTPVATFTPFPIVTSGPNRTPTSPVSVIDLRGPTVNGIGTYIVLPGDTFEAIARRYNVTVQTLAALNGIVNPRNIVIGQVLAVPGPGNNVPGGTVAPTVVPTRPGTGGVARTHVVQPGDNLYRLSVRYGVTMDALMRLNGISNPNLIFVGQVLRIP